MWETPVPYQEFQILIEKFKTRYVKSLTRQYSYVRASHIDDRRGVIVLGPGGGQVLEMMGMPGELVTGIDISPENIAITEQRLPGALFIEALFEEGLEVVDPHPTIFASDALDCVPPHKLGLVCQLMAERGERVVAVQNFVPDTDYYGAEEGNETFFRSRIAQTPLGIENTWPEDRLWLLDDLVAEMGITDPLSDVNLTIAQVQRATERDLGFTLPWSVIESYTHLRLGNPESLILEQFWGHMSPFGQVVQIFDNRIADYEEVFIQKLPSNSHEYLQAAHNLGMLHMMYGTLSYMAYHALLEHELQLAGFQNIHRQKTFANRKELLRSAQAGQILRGSMDQDFRPMPRQKHAKMNVQLNGGAFTTRGHRRRAAELTSMEVLVAE